MRSNSPLKVYSLCVAVIAILATATVAQDPRIGDPGVSEGAIVIGSIVQTTGPMAQKSLAVKAVEMAFFDQLNRQGGINGRQVEVKFFESANSPKETRAAFEKFLVEQNIFAMFGGFGLVGEKEILAVVEQSKVPLIGPTSFYPHPGQQLNRQVFYLVSGLENGVRAVIGLIRNSTTFKAKNLGVVYYSELSNVSTTEVIKEQIKKDGLSAESYPLPRARFDPYPIVERLKDDNRDFVLFMGSGNDGVLLLKEMERIQWFPRVYIGGGIGNGLFQLSPEFNEKIFLTSPAAPADKTPEGLAEFKALAEKYQLPSKQVDTQIPAYASAKILAEGLRLAGRDLTREKLIQSLETLSNFSTGLLPPVTYNANRHVGAQGAYIMKVDLKTKRFVFSDWNEVN